MKTESTRTRISRKCPHCWGEFDVISVSVRTIEGYVNPLTGKNAAFVEHLSCGHEFVDGKFNVDAIYFTNPKPMIPEYKASVVNYVPITYTPYKRKTGVNVMDVCVLCCMGFLVVAFPPLVLLPALYYIGRISSK